MDVHGVPDSKLLEHDNMRSLGLDAVGEGLLACMAKAEQWQALTEWMALVKGMAHLTSKPPGWGEGLPRSMIQSMAASP